MLPILLPLWGLSQSPRLSRLWRPVTWAVGGAVRSVARIFARRSAHGRQDGLGTARHIEGQVVQDGAQSGARASEDEAQAKVAQEQADAEASAKIDRMKKKRRPVRLAAPAPAATGSGAGADLISPMASASPAHVASAPGGVPLVSDLPAAVRAPESTHIRARTHADAHARVHTHTHTHTDELLAQARSSCAVAEVSEEALSEEAQGVGVGSADRSEGGGGGGGGTARS
jgi:hypothetical protein